MRSVFSQPVGRGFRGSGNSSFTQPLTLFMREFYLVAKSMLDNFSNHIKQESKNCDGILNEMQNFIFSSSVIQFCFKLTIYYQKSSECIHFHCFRQCRHCSRDYRFEATRMHFRRCYPDFRLNLSSEVRRIPWRRHIQN